MAHCKPLTGYFADQPNVPYQSHQHPSVLPCPGRDPFGTSAAPPTPAFTTLSYRVAALEEQFAKTIAEKTETDRAIQYLLRARVDDLNKAQCSKKVDQTISMLRYKLVRAKQENRTLQATIRLIRQLNKNSHQSSALNKRQQCSCPVLNQGSSPKTINTWVTGDLIDLFVSDHSTAVDVSEKDTISSVPAVEEVNTNIGADSSDEEEASHKKPTTHESVEFFQDQYIYRFGHVAVCSTAINSDISREQSPNKDTEKVVVAAFNTVEDLKANTCQDSRLATYPHVSASASDGKKSGSAIRSLPEKARLPHKSFEELSHEIALPSVNNSFDSLATTATSFDGKQITSPFIKPHYAREAASIGAEIFETAFERERAIHNHKQHTGSQDLRFPDLFRYGLHFDADRLHRNVYRTVLISDLPSHVTMTSLLEQVRGGLVIEARLLNTENITGHQTGWIAFQRENAARAFFNYAEHNTITFEGKSVTVTMLETPTWPISMMLQNSITNFKHTRCLEVHKFPHDLISPTALRRELRICHAVAWDAIEHVAMRDDGVVELRFSSIKYAGQAFGILTRHSKFRQCVTHFAADPCAQPLHATVDQTGRLEKSGWDGLTNQDPSVFVHGRGFDSLD